MNNRRLKILLIEDNPADVYLVREMLNGVHSFNCELINTDRLEKCHTLPDRERIDVILLDLSLPDVQGLETVVKTCEILPGKPIVIMSGLEDEDLAVRALQEGAQDYLVKGQVDSNLLVRSIRYAIERKVSEDALWKAYLELENRVQERTGELVEANQSLRRSEASLAEAQRIAHIGNWVWDIRSNELYWSDEIYRIFGLTQKQSGTTYEAFLNSIHPEDREFVKNAVNEALYGRPYNIEHRIILPDDSVRFVHEQGEVTFGESDEPVRILGTVQDITDKKEQEIRLIMSERLAALGQMASGIAHEINNPLATIAACAEGLLNRLRKGRFEKELFQNYLDIIVQEVARCKGITTSMLSFVRKAIYDKKEIDIHKVLDKTLELIGFQGRLKDVSVIKKYHGMLTAHGSEGDMRQVFLAIILNALDAMEDRGALTLETGICPSASNAKSKEPGEGGPIFIIISDTGTGIPPGLTGKIFDSFFTTKTEKGGTGLGLSIANKIIKDHNGSIHVTSEKGKGAAFHIVLPG